MSVLQKRGYMYKASVGPSFRADTTHSSPPKALLVVLHLIRIAGPLAAVSELQDHAGHVVTAVPATKRLGRSRKTHCKGLNKSTKT